MKGDGEDNESVEVVKKNQMIVFFFLVVLHERSILAGCGYEMLSGNDQHQPR
eukprot:m.17729 g.17729  ORF g.17729 m.17729 type:complete len:52 (+) comp8348_c0_seq1:219-374(+)